LVVKSVPSNGDIISVYSYDAGKIQRSFESTPGHAAPKIIEILSGDLLNEVKAELESALRSGEGDEAAIQALLAVVKELLRASEPVSLQGGIASTISQTAS